MGDKRIRSSRQIKGKDVWVTCGDGHIQYVRGNVHVQQSSTSEEQDEMVSMCVDQLCIRDLEESNNHKYSREIINIPEKG